MKSDRALLTKARDSTWSIEDIHEQFLREKKIMRLKPKFPKVRRTTIHQTRRAESPLATTFRWIWGTLPAVKFIELTPEHQFDPARKWKSDFAHVEAKVLIELEGGTWSGGRHTRGRGYQNDCEKYNRAHELGWVVQRLTGKMITTKNLTEIQKLIEKRRNLTS